MYHSMCDPNKGDSDPPKVHHLYQNKKEKKFLSKGKAVYVKRQTFPWQSLQTLTISLQILCKAFINRHPSPPPFL